MGRTISLWTTAGWLAFLYIYGLCFATKNQITVFFLPMLIESVLLAGGIILVYYRVPEKWCLESRFIQLYLTSYIIYSILFVNFCFETQTILYMTLKLNSGNLSDIDAWWKLPNVYNDP